MKKYIYTTILSISILVSPNLVFGAQKNLSVPFRSQAPEGIWTEPWANACEETSISMIDAFYYKRPLTIERVKRQIQELIYIENQFHGTNKDNTANQMAEIINLFLTWEAKVVENPTVADIKTQIDLGRPVIMPVHGRDLNNAAFKTEQIDYHVFVISGYDDATQEFITQEPATKDGLDYRYTYDTIMTAMHDFLPSDNTYKGRRVAVFTSPTATFSLSSDGDGDGLSKADEIKYGTSLSLTDTDKDGYSDGLEVANGYSPRTNELALKNGDLVKMRDNPDVYLLENNIARKIASMEVFRSHNWVESAIQLISEKFFDMKYKIGEVITT